MTRSIANVEAEAALIGTMMIDNRTVSNVSHMLTAEHFYEPLYGRLFAAIVDIVAEGGTATPITLRPRFANDPSMEELGGVRHLAMLTGSGAALIGYVQFAQQIRELADLRRMVAVMEAGIEQARDTGKEINPRAVMENVTSGLTEAAVNYQRAVPRSAADMIRKARARAAEIRGGASRGATCVSLPDVNALLGPLQPKTLTVIGGRPSMGKSVLAQSLAWGYAAGGTPTALISLEMAEEALAMRLTSDLTHALDEPIPLRDLQEGKISEDADRVLDWAERAIEHMPLDLISPDRGSISEIEAHIARLVEKWKRRGKKLGVVFVDYLQIIAAGKSFNNPRERIDFLSERLLGIAKRYELAIVVLSQLSRSVEMREGARPQLSDLKESGRIEEDADNVILVWRQEYYLERDKKQEGDKGYEDWMVEYERSRNRVDLIAPKVRQGEVGVKRVKWFGANQAIRGSSWEEPFMDKGNDLIPREWLQAA